MSSCSGAAERCEQYEQLELPLVVPVSFDQLIAAKRLSGLTLAYNKRLVKSWRMTIQPRTRDRHLVVPACLADAPPDVKEALLEWAMLPNPRRSRRTSEIRGRKADLEALIWGFIESRIPHCRLSRAVDPLSYERETHGVRYELTEVFDSVNHTFFNGSVRAYVRWGTCASLTSHASQRRRPDGSPFDLITIAGAYDHPLVPRFAIEGIMYHEMLHIVIPPTRHNGRRVVHGTEFRQAERRFPQFREWEDWQRRNLRRLAASLRRTKRSTKS